MDWVILRVKEKIAYVAPSARWPFFHSPYSTVSASSANIRVLISWTPKPLTAMQTSASTRHARRARRTG